MTRLLRSRWDALKRAPTLRPYIGQDENETAGRLTDALPVVVLVF
jgi:hypothetical protein